MNGESTLTGLLFVDRGTFSSENVLLNFSRSRFGKLVHDRESLRNLEVRHVGAREFAKFGFGRS